MNLDDAITGRRSIRAYSDKKPSKEKVLEIISAGIKAPSACNYQLWKYVIIDDYDLKKSIVDNGGTPLILKAPLGILVLYHNVTDNMEYMDYIQSASASIQNMLLKSHSIGLGSCWICHLPKKSALRKLVQIPEHYDPIAYITIGYSEQDTKDKVMKYSVDKVTSHNLFNFEESTHNSKKIMTKSFFRRIYYLLPTSFKRLVNKIVNYFFEIKH